MILTIIMTCLMFFRLTIIIRTNIDAISQPVREYKGKITVVRLTTTFHVGVDLMTSQDWP